MRFTFFSKIVLTFLVLLSIVIISTLTATADRNTIIPNAEGNYSYLPLVLRNSTGLNSATPVPWPTATPTPTPLPLGGTSRFGVWIGNDEGGKANPAKQTGAGWVRVTLFWSHIEPNYTDPPNYNFDYYDTLFSAISSAGLTPIVEIRGNPTSWAASTSCGPINQDKINAFGRFLRALTEHYSGSNYNVKNWELYNEPDQIDPVYGNWVGGCWGDQPAKYVEMLQVAYSSIKSIDPSAKILLGGLAHEATPPDPPPSFNTHFLDDILEAGADQYVDIINIHYFSSQSPTWSAYGRDIAGKVGKVRQTLANRGISKPIIVTESSWTSSDPGLGDFREKQARYVPKLLARSLAIDLYAVIWFSLADWEGEGSDVPYGLLDVNLAPKPSSQAFRFASAEFSTAASVRPLSAIEVGVQAGIEGYVFNVSGQERWVLWAEGHDVTITIPARATAAKDKLGQDITLAGGGGPTSFVLTESPIYVRY